MYGGIDFRSDLLPILHLLVRAHNNEALYIKKHKPSDEEIYSAICNVLSDKEIAYTIR